MIQIAAVTYAYDCGCEVGFEADHMDLHPCAEHSVTDLNERLATKVAEWREARGA